MLQRKIKMITSVVLNWLFICMPVAWAHASDVFDVVSIAPGTYVHYGQVALTDPENAGDIANLGFVVGRDAVAVIDTGGSVAVGAALLQAIRRITELPIRYVVNTHEHPDHVFGNAAFAPASAVFVGHRNLPASLASRGAFYVQAFRGVLGAAAVGAVKIIPPEQLVADTMRLDLGGRTLLLTAWSRAAHSDCDLTVIDEATDTLFAGDLLFLDHVPVIDGSINGWLAQLPALAALPATRVVAGHGRRIADWPEALDDERRYLQALQSDTRGFIAAGIPLARALLQIGQGERDRWLLFDAYNPRNATAAYSELEWE